jgi:hypothetical protein
VLGLIPADLSGIQIENPAKAMYYECETQHVSRPISQQLIFLLFELGMNSVCFVNNSTISHKYFLRLSYCLPNNQVISWNNNNFLAWIPDKSAELDSRLSDIFAADCPE